MNIKSLGPSPCAGLTVIYRPGQIRTQPADTMKLGPAISGRPHHGLHPRSSMKPVGPHPALDRMRADPKLLGQQSGTVSLFQEQLHHPQPELHREGQGAIRNRVAASKLFVTFDIDFVDPAYAPGTGTIEVGGFTSYEALEFVGGLKGLNFVGFDLVEVLPAYDPTEITAALGATLMQEFISLIAQKKRDCMASI
jgi:hypothetical protein